MEITVKMISKLIGIIMAMMSLMAETRGEVDKATLWMAWAIFMMVA